MAVTGGALPTKALLDEAMRKAGMLPLSHDERQAALEAAFNTAFEEDDDFDPEQQEWVISGSPEPEE